MRKILLLALTLNCMTVYGQLNEIEAKAAYLLAEENYNKADYPTALKFLDNAKKSLGGTNSKLLYLQIMTELELYKKDVSYYDKLIASITEFQSAPDVKTFNQEKVLEVMKAKMTITEQREKQIAEMEAAKARDEVFEQKINLLGFDGWPLGISLTELIEINKESPVFSKKLKSSEVEGSGLTMYFSNASFGIDGVTIFTNGDKVVGYRKKTYYANNYADKSASQEKQKEYTQQLIENMSGNFGFDPVIEEKDVHYYYTYKWSKYGKTVRLNIRHVIDGKGKWWHSTVVEDILIDGFDLNTYPPDVYLY